MCDVDCNDADPTISPLEGEHCSRRDRQRLRRRTSTCRTPTTIVLVQSGSVDDVPGERNRPLADGSLGSTRPSTTAHGRPGTYGDRLRGHAARRGEPVRHGGQQRHLLRLYAHPFRYHRYERGEHPVPGRRFRRRFCRLDQWCGGLSFDRKCPAAAGISTGTPRPRTASPATRSTPDYGTLIDISTAGIPGVGQRSQRAGGRGLERPTNTSDGSRARSRGCR